MGSPLDALNQKFAALSKAADQGKLISTSLEAEDKPSREKLIFLSVITLGIYYAYYTYTHDRERVFKHLTDEIDKTLRAYQGDDSKSGAELSSSPLLLNGSPHENRPKVEQLLRIKQRIEAALRPNMGENLFCDSFKTELLNDGENHVTAGGIKSYHYHLLWDAASPSQSLKESILAHVKQDIEKETQSPFKETVLDQLTKPEKPEMHEWSFRYDSEKQKFNWELNIGLTAIKPFQGQIEAPKITNQEMLTKINTALEQYTRGIEQQKTADIIKVKAAVKKVGVIVNKMWANNLSIEKNQIVAQENIALHSLYTSWYTSIENDQRYRTFAELQKK